MRVVFVQASNEWIMYESYMYVMNVSQMYHVFNILTETVDERQRVSINLFEK